MILDLHSRKIIAWRLAKKMKTQLVIETLKDALSTRSVRDELILHSDRGMKCTSKEYTNFP
ncbi:MAG: DDE-type integrase/transposase/recombinase [Streptococcus sp.]|nr:DDE-type integrase/transposase/recombinase [Streptococcus sp.]